jgi:hypothetical protein
MSVLPSLKKKRITFFIDWNKFKNCFYNNLYLEDYKIVVKMPLIPQDESEKDIVKIKRFDLTRYTYLVSY